MKNSRILIIVLTLLSIHLFSYSQIKVDSLHRQDTVRKNNERSPRVATIRSAIIPGWGQVTNKKYWKLPLVYGALGITGYVFVDNIRFYNKIRTAYQILQSGDTTGFRDKVDPSLVPLVEAGDLESLRRNRNSFRQNIDYSVLFFLFFWGLNVLDATVDAHLKGFNVTDDLSMKIKPSLNYNNAGVSIAFNIHKGTKKLFPVNNLPAINNFYEHSLNRIR